MFRFFYSFLAHQVGLDARKFILFPGRFFFFVIDVFKFITAYKNVDLRFSPCIHDKGCISTIDKEYFPQDLFVAQKIFERNPLDHSDVGSRLDGFVAHLASFRQLDVFDIRPLGADIKNINFNQLDITDTRAVEKLGSVRTSVSCLHVVEHFGLGRYGDDIDPRGLECGVNNLLRLLAPGGTLYLSTPIGTPVIRFNSHRVTSHFDLQRLITIASGIMSEIYVLNEWSFNTLCKIKEL